MKQARSLKKLETEQRKNKNLDYIGDTAEFSSIISHTHQTAKSSSLENNINGHNDNIYMYYLDSTATPTIPVCIAQDITSKDNKVIWVDHHARDVSIWHNSTEMFDRIKLVRYKLQLNVC